MAHIVTAWDLLDGHAVLDIECLDRVYLNAYVPILQSSGQVVAFMTQHLGMPIPSPALMEKIGTKFRRAVYSFASANGIPWVKFGKDDRKIDVMTPYLDRQAATGRSGVAAIGVAQEWQRVWAAYQRDTRTAAPQYTFAKADRRVTCYYFYLWDEDSGSAFIKVCAYFPYSAKIWVNGHEWAKRQALKAGIGFTSLSSGFASCTDPAGLQAICDRLQPGTIEVFAQRWLHRLPVHWIHHQARIRIAALGLRRPAAAGDLTAGDHGGGGGMVLVAPDRVLPRGQARVDRRVRGRVRHRPLPNLGVRPMRTGLIVPADLDLHAIQLGRRVQDQGADVSAEI